MNEQFNFVLTSPIKYASKGEEVLGFIITGKAPTAKCRNQLIVLKQLILQAFNSLQKKNDVKQEAQEQGDSSDIKGSDLIMMLYMSDIDVVKLMNTVRDLFVVGQLLTIDELVVLPAHLVDQIGMEDFENLAGEYLASFLLPSLLRR